LAGGYGISSRPVAALNHLASALQWAEDQPMALLHLRTDRQADAGLRQALRRTMAGLRCDSDAEHPFS
jgi:2-succinyl-5-enolpyruvyl-6-hydroxy-3-cyclohexene-1-carboxylate synthase